MVIEDGEIIRCELSADNADSCPAAASGTPSAAASNPAGLGIASHAAQIGDFLNAIDGGRQPSVTGDDGRAALEVACAVYESARDGRTVRLPAAPDVRGSPAGS